MISLLVSPFVVIRPSSALSCSVFTCNEFRNAFFIVIHYITRAPFSQICCISASGAWSGGPLYNNSLPSLTLNAPKHPTRPVRISFAPLRPRRKQESPTRPGEIICIAISAENKKMPVLPLIETIPKVRPKESNDREVGSTFASTDTFSCSLYCHKAFSALSGFPRLLTNSVMCSVSARPVGKHLCRRKRHASSH